MQRGPKSYTYGLFIKALELFHDAGSDGCDLQVSDAANGGRSDDDGGLEAFLDDCDDEEEDYEDEEDEGGEELDDMMYNSTTFGNGDLMDQLQSTSSTKAEGMMKELRALEALHSSLKEAMEQCENNSLIRRSGVEERIYTTAEDEYCVILIKSEMQTISFYTKATEMIHSKLSKSLSQVNSLVESKIEMIAMDRDREHINDLVKAFMTIRYPGVSI